MFGLFKKKTEKDKMREAYEKLMKEAHFHSTTNRRLSDQKVAEAMAIWNRLESME